MNNDLNNNETNNMPSTPNSALENNIDSQITLGGAPTEPSIQVPEPIQTVQSPNPESTGLVLGEAPKPVEPVSTPVIEPKPAEITPIDGSTIPVPNPVPTTVEQVTPIAEQPPVSSGITPQPVPEQSVVTPTVEPTQTNIQPNASIPNSQPATPTEPQKKKKSPLVIIGIIVVVIAAIVFAVKMIGGKNGNMNSSSGSSNLGGAKSGTTINQGEELKIFNDYTKAIIKVEEVQREVVASSFSGDQKFTKIKISITNKNEKDMNSILNSFKTVDESNNETGDQSCYDIMFGKAIYGETMADAIDLAVLSGETTSGYIYCLDESNIAKKLKITSVTKISTDGNHIESTGEDIFYINLN